MKQIFAEKAPAAIGPYCHAVVHGDMVFCSGQIPLDPKTMTIVGATIEEQTAQVMKNIETVLSEVGTTLNKIVKTTIFLDTMDDFMGMNTVYEDCLNGHKPARSAFEVGRLPKDALIEIECIAVIE
ncbi:MAG: RidA family protein [Proteobacteria bacterium]|nr:RidA family protein [Pseudomonadota bacterium]MBU1584999.1 RidA family protein [Pseudomonadota bacterium]MBU2453939.1 RidA family protein [Pseudomonadota bacterium]MBU2630318.1 RidA family protein [Pseudomonadota bacterium]